MNCGTPRHSPPHRLPWPGAWQSPPPRPPLRPCLIDRVSFFCPRPQLEMCMLQQGSEGGAALPQLGKNPQRGLLIEQEGLGFSTRSPYLPKLGLVKCQGRLDSKRRQSLCLSPLEQTWTQTPRPRRLMVLGSKELGTNVLEFYFVMLANNDQNVFSLVQTCSKYKLESSCCRIYCVNLHGSIDRELDSIDRSLCRLCFLQNFQLSPSSFDVQGFMFCLKYKRGLKTNKWYQSRLLSYCRSFYLRADP